MVVVTGAARGIGREVARRLRAEGRPVAGLLRAGGTPVPDDALDARVELELGEPEGVAAALEITRLLLPNRRRAAGTVVLLNSGAGPDGTITDLTLRLWSGRGRG